MRDCRPGRSRRTSGSTMVTLPSNSMPTAIPRAEEADDQALDHERPADEPVGGADQAHHLDLAAARVDREADRVADQQQRGDQQQDGDHGEDDLDRAGDLADLLGLLARVDDRRRSTALIGCRLAGGVGRLRAARTASRLSGSSSLTLKEGGSGFELSSAIEQSQLSSSRPRGASAPRARARCSRRRSTWGIASILRCSVAGSRPWSRRR